MSTPFCINGLSISASSPASLTVGEYDFTVAVYDNHSSSFTELQPEESIQLMLMAKNLETLDMQLEPVTLNLNFSDTYKSFRSDAYKRLILDAAAGNPSLFIHRDEVDHAWAWIDPIIAAWKQNVQPPHLYRAGSWGPDESDQLFQNGGRWFNSGEGL